MCRALISDRDERGLRAMLVHWPRANRLEEEAAQALEIILSRARVVSIDQLPSEVVTMDARVAYVDNATGDYHMTSIVYPEHAATGAGRTSILSPIGYSLIGRFVGSIADVFLPTGRHFTVRIADVKRREAGDALLTTAIRSDSVADNPF